MRLLRRSVGPGPVTGDDPQRDSVACRPDAHAFTLLHHSDQFVPGSVSQRLNDLENDRVPQGSVRGVELPLDHHPLSELAGRQFAIDS